MSERKLAPLQAQLSTVSTLLFGREPRLRHVSVRERHRVRAALRSAERSDAARKALGAALARSQKAAAARMGPGAAAAHAHARAAAETRTETKAGPTTEGWHTTEQSKLTAAEQGQVGNEAEVIASETKDFGHGVSASASVAEKQGTLVDRCPDAQGIVPVNVERGFKLTLSASVGGHEIASGIVYTELKGTAKGHVDEEGKVTSFDLDVMGTFFVQWVVRDTAGRVVETNPPELLTAHFVVDGIPPEREVPQPDGEVETIESDLPASAGPTSVGVTEGISLATARDMYSALYMEAILASNGVGEHLHYAEEDWRCTTVTPTAPTTTPGPGQQVPVTVTVSGPQSPPGKGTAPGKFTASASAGSVSPASGTYEAGQPIKLTFTAPPSGDATLTVSTASKQGFGEGSIVFHVEGGHYDLVYTHSSSAEYSYPYEPVQAPPEGCGGPCGTFSEAQAIGLSATVPLGGEATSARPASGAAALGWTAGSSWATVDESTTLDNAGGGGGGERQTCDLRDKMTVTSFDPGTVEVKSLTLGARAGGVPSVSLDLVLGGAKEGWHQDDEPVAGPCPGHEGDYPAATYLGDLDSFYQRLGVPVTDRSPNAEEPAELLDELTLDSGWQAGSGNVVAERTFDQTVPAWSGYALEAPPSATVHWTDTFQIVKASG